MAWSGGCWLAKDAGAGVQGGAWQRVVAQMMGYVHAAEERVAARCHACAEPLIRRSAIGPAVLAAPKSDLTEID